MVKEVFLSRRKNDTCLEYGSTQKIKNTGIGTSLVVQWLRLRAPTAGGTGSMPGWGTKVSHVVRPKQNKVLFLWRMLIV